jgi:hypothetical protein
MIQDSGVRGQRSEVRGQGFQILKIKFETLGLGLKNGGLL